MKFKNVLLTGALLVATCAPIAANPEFQEIQDKIQYMYQLIKEQFNILGSMGQHPEGRIICLTFSTIHDNIYTSYKTLEDIRNAIKIAQTENLFVHFQAETLYLQLDELENSFIALLTLAWFNIFDTEHIQNPEFQEAQNKIKNLEQPLKEQCSILEKQPIIPYKTFMIHIQDPELQEAQNKIRYLQQLLREQMNILGTMGEQPSYDVIKSKCSTIYNNIIKPCETCDEINNSIQIAVRKNPSLQPQAKILYQQLEWLDHDLNRLIWLTKHDNFSLQNAAPSPMFKEAWGLLNSIYQIKKELRSTLFKELDTPIDIDFDTKKQIFTTAFTTLIRICDIFDELLISINMAVAKDSSLQKEALFLHKIISNWKEDCSAFAYYCSPSNLKPKN